MYRHRRKIIGIMSGFLAVLLIVSLVAMAMPGLRAGAAESLSSLQNRRKSLQSQKSELANVLAKIQQERTGAMNEKINLENQLEVLEEQITTSEDLIEALKGNIADKEHEIELAEQDEADEFELFKLRVRVMEENSHDSYLGLLLGANSFSEMLSRLEVINDIIAYDRGVMDDLRAARERKEEAKAEYESMLSENEAIHQELVDQQAEFQQKSVELDELIEEINASYEVTSSEIAALETDISAVQKEISRIEEENRKRAEQSKYVGGEFLWPLPSPYYSGYITQGFKYRVHQFTGKYGLHGGIDIGCPRGTSIYAANDGTVVTSTKVTSYGNYVMIDHGGNVYTLYAHMSQRLVSVGDKVTRGQVIGKVGDTGYATGPHLHFEIRKDGQYINPMNEFK